MTTTQLTPAQHSILAYALEHTGGKIDWFPDNIKGGARKKVLDGLFNRALITTDGTHWFVAAEGYDAMGRERPAPAPVTARPRTRRSRDGSRGHVGARKRRQPTKPRTRENSKQATVIQMLQRPEGATIAADLRDHRLAGAHGARHLRRCLQEEARPDHRLGQGPGRRAGLPDRLIRKIEKEAKQRLASQSNSALLRVSQRSTQRSQR
jgi:hypothetical protein